MTSSLRCRARRLGLSAFLVAGVLSPIGAAAPAVAGATMHPSIAMQSNARPAVARTKTAKGWTPQELAAAYGVKWSPQLGAGQTVAVVDAYDSQYVQSDLAAFSTAFGLPQCTVANGCFKEVNQTGATSPLPSNHFNLGWATEIDLDTQWVHALAPAAHIVLIEADDLNLKNLAASEQTANSMADVTYITNSWGEVECRPGDDPRTCITQAQEAPWNSAFVPGAGKTILFATGDYGLPASYPSTLTSVVAVGGTSLKAGKTTTEVVWDCGTATKSKPNACLVNNGAGGGCSVFNDAAPAQATFKQYAQAGCNGKRSTPDLSAVADPSTGVPVYMSDFGKPGFEIVGGTSLAAPIVTALAADAGKRLDAATIYGSSMTFRDANTKKAKDPTNGAVCMTGYDLCTGRGAWINAVP